MKRDGNKLNFENNKEKEDFLFVVNFIISFYNTKSEVKRLFNNLCYLKTEKNSSYIECFRNETEGILYLLEYEHPNFINYLNEYKKNKENTLIDFALRRCCTLFIKKATEWNVI